MNAMKEEKLINISNLSYQDALKYEWKATEEMKVKKDKWSRKYECKKTGAKGFRSGGFL
jgi:hypothetical protein